MTEDNYISQSADGIGNQLIAQMTGGTAIAKVEQLIQNFHVSPQNIRTLERFWQDWSQDTKPPFSPDLVISGREVERALMINWLRDNPAVLTLQGDSQKEVGAFFAAVVQGLEVEERDKFLSRAIVVNCTTSWQHLIASTDPFILIAELENPEGIGTALHNGHHVFISSQRVSSNNKNLLPRIVRGAAEKALKGMGLSDTMAHNLALLARRSLSALRRKLAIAPSTQIPTWAKPNEAHILLAPLLASSWNDTCESDRKALENLSGLAYEDLQTHLTRWTNEPDAPIRRTGNIWMIASQQDAWLLIARYLTSDNLDRFKAVAIEVLGEINPKFELPPEERYAAAIYKKVLRHSENLRAGISDMLALMATLSADVPFAVSETGEDIANQIVWQLMKKAKDNGLVWASLADKLPILAEAAPEELLRAIDTDLTGNNPLLASLFQDKTTRAACYSPHTGLLWALENLAFNPDYRCQSALCLARLTRLDQGVNVGNRAIGSLKNIFIWWIYLHPDANIHFDDCLHVIKTIYKREPHITWDLMMTLTSFHNISIMRHQIRWRDWVTNPRKEFTEEEHTKATDAILTLLISNTDKHTSRWCSLITSARRMDINKKYTIIRSLETLEPQNFSLEEQIKIYDCLNDEIIHYSQHPLAWWSVPSECVKQLEVILVKFEPNNLIYRYLYLFSYGVKLRDNQNLSFHDEIFEGMRTKALQEILQEHGWDGIIQLSSQVQQPGFVGFTLAKSQLLPIDLSQFLRENLCSSDQWRSQLAQSYIFLTASVQGECWMQQFLDNNLHTWSPTEYGELLLHTPFNTYSLDRLDASSLETQQYFWKRIQHINFLGIDYASRILSKLLEFGRPCFAVTQFPYNSQEIFQLFSPEKVADVLAESVQNESGKDYDKDSFFSTSVKLMNYLEKTDLCRDRYANLELMYFPAHHHQRDSKALFDNLARNPEFFVSALQCMFPKKNESTSEDSDENNEYHRELAKLAGQLLNEWKQIPGASADGTINKETLNSWVFRAREMATECDLSDWADIFIGNLLAFSPPDTDGTWPHKIVRDLIEELESTNIEDGWRTQILNNRGIFSMSSIDGGKQERELVEKYMQYFRQFKNQWPRTATVLRDVASRYNQDALTRDNWAELTQDSYR
jgi:hypothetical protein